MPRRARRLTDDRIFEVIADRSPDAFRQDRAISLATSLRRARFILAGPSRSRGTCPSGRVLHADRAVMTVDATPAIRDFGWNPRTFHPRFD